MNRDGIRQATCIIIRKGNEFLVGVILKSTDLRWSTSPYDAWSTRERRDAEMVAGDPEGIVEVRQLIKRMQEEWGVTVLISSHLLSELSELCTDFSIISHGELIENLSREELLIRCRNHIALRTDDINKTAAVLEDRLSIHDYRVIHGEEIQIFEHLSDVYHISKILTDNGLVIIRLNEGGQTCYGVLTAILFLFHVTQRNLC